MMQTLKKYPLVFLFAAFLLIVSAANLLTPDREKSELENRPLAQRPKLTATALLAKDQENKYTQRFETYLNDQFVGRDGVDYAQIGERIGARKDREQRHRLRVGQLPVRPVRDSGRAPVFDEHRAACGPTCLLPGHRADHCGGHPELL